MHRLASIDLLKAIACLLIINSHCVGLYPIDFFALGGGQGNVIFFIVAGYLCANIRLPWNAWISKRYGRLIPVTLVMCLADFAIVSMSGLMHESILIYYLNKYWFIWAIIIYYIPYFYALSHVDRPSIKRSVAVYCIGYILLYMACCKRGGFFVEAEGFAPLKVYFYFLPMYIGGLMNRLVHAPLVDSQGSRRPRRANLKLFVFASLIGLSIWGAAYLLVRVFDTGYEWQFLINVGNLIFGLSFVHGMILKSDSSFIEQLGNTKLVRVLANCTLEIYLVQISIKPFFLDTPFPRNVLLYFIVSISLGVVLHEAMKNCTNSLMCILRKG